MVSPSLSTQIACEIPAITMQDREVPAQRTDPCEEGARAPLWLGLMLAALSQATPATARADSANVVVAPPPEAASPLLNAIEASPVSFIIRIYALHYGRKLSEHDELVLGLSYANIAYDSGRSHAPGLILGYRRYFWRGLHLEYQLWPSYNHFYGYAARKYYDGFELWNELRPGYTFELDFTGIPLYLNLQWLFGWGYFGTASKPQEWRDEVEAEENLFDLPIFNMPAFFFGLRF